MIDGIDLTHILESPYGFLLAYPDGEPSTLIQRIQARQKLGVDRIYRAGSKPLKPMQDFKVLRLGYCGLMVLARWKGQIVALKL